MVNIDEFLIPDITPAKTIKVKVLDDSMQPVKKARFKISADNGEVKEYETNDEGVIPVIVGQKEGGTKLNVRKVYEPSTI